MDFLLDHIETVDDLVTILPVTVKIELSAGRMTMVCHTVLDLTKAIVIGISNGHVLQVESYRDR